MTVYIYRSQILSPGPGVLVNDILGCWFVSGVRSTWTSSLQDPSRSNSPRHDPEFRPRGRGRTGSSETIDGVFVSLVGGVNDDVFAGKLKQLNKILWCYIDETFIYTYTLPHAHTTVFSKSFLNFYLLINTYIPSIPIHPFPANVSLPE